MKMIRPFTLTLALSFAMAGAASIHAQDAAPADTSAPAAKSAPAEKTAPAEKAAPAEKTATTAPSDSTAALKAEVKVAKEVQDREPVEPADSFSADTTQVIGWSRITGANEPVDIKHIWSLNGKEVASIPLQVKSSSYRTWTRKTVSPGKWTFSVQTADGATLASKDFTVGGEAPAK